MIYTANLESKHENRLKEWHQIQKEENYIVGKEKKRKSKADNSIDTVLGIAWYSSDQWERLRHVVSDPGNLEDTYEEWLSIAEKALQDYAKTGAKIRRVHIDVEELVAWCKSKNIPLNGASRSEFASEKLYQEMEVKE